MLNKNTANKKKIQAIFLILAIALMFLSFNALAVTFSFCHKLNSKGYCNIDGRTQKKEPFTHIVHCGNSYLTIRASDKDTLNSYLRNNKNMVVKHEKDKFFLDGSCF